MERKRSPSQLIMLFCLGAAFSSFFIAICTIIGGLLSHTSGDVKQVIHINSNDTVSEYQSACTYHNCFDVYACVGDTSKKITVFIYPDIEFLDEKQVVVNPPVSKEFKAIVDAIRKSEFYTSDPRDACLFLPYLDVLNQERLRVDYLSKALPKLPYWNDGKNHLFFNMLPGSSPDFARRLEVVTGFGLIAGGGFSAFVFRNSLDVSIPVYSPWLEGSQKQNNQRSWFIISSQPYLSRRYMQHLAELSAKHDDVLITSSCPPEMGLSKGGWRCGGDGKAHKNPEFLQEGVFCLVLQAARLGQPVLMEALASGCIPVVAIDNYVLPFSDVLEWKRAAVLLYEHQLPDLYSILKNLTSERIESLQDHGRYFYQEYMSSMGKIALTTLNIINERVRPLLSKGYDGWNIPPAKVEKQDVFVLPMGPPKTQGFTAVVLTYDRLESLFTVIENLALVPSLSHIVVVWNNQKKNPPPLNQWPDVKKPLTVIKSDTNILSNRFLPFKEIQTEAVLSIDDDINMLTTDELEFGYQVWREFPDRIVGYPSRTHVWSNVTNSWLYDSEWGNSYSLILTGASFYHKYWHHVYAKELPPSVKQFVDEHMNCEDIAMNFLFANKTRKAPIKVTPRKKFKCPTCTGEMLSADAGHLAERSFCVNYFAKAFGITDLKYAEFRADPVLYRDPVPQPFKLYSDIGSL